MDTCDARTHLLAGLSLLAPLSRPERELVAACFVPISYDFGEIVVAEGEIADAFYVIAAGRARALTIGDDGSEVPINLLGPGDSFGEVALIEQSPRSATIRASSELQVLRLDGSVFLALLHLHPKLSAALAPGVAALRQGDVLRDHPAFTGLPRERLADLARATRKIELSDGARLGSDAVGADGFLLVASGRLTLVDDAGAALHHLHAGDVVDAAGACQRGEALDARGDASLLHLGADALADLFADHPTVCTRLVKRAALVERRRHRQDTARKAESATVATEEDLLARIAEDDDVDVDEGVSVARRRRRRHFAVVRQIDSMDCGAACVATLCRHYGYDVSLPAIRSAVGTGLDGTSLRGILRGGAEIGIEFRTVKSSPDRLDALPTPLILHWGGNHWVVLHEVRGDKAYVADPAVGLRVVPRAQLIAEWSGYAAIPTPTERLADAPRGGLRLGWLAPLVRPYRKALLGAALLALVATGLQMALPILTQVVVDGLLNERGAGFASMVVGLIALALLGAVGATVLQRRTFARVAVAVDGKALDHVAERLLRLPIGYFQARRTADIQRRLEGLREIRRVLVEQGVAGATAAFQLLVAFIVMAAYSWILCLLFLVVVPAYGLLMRYSSRWLKPTFDALEEAFGRYQGKQLDSIRGIEVVKVSGAEEGFRRTLLAEFDGLQERLLRRDVTLLTYDGLVALTTLGLVALFLWVGALLVDRGALSVGGLVAVNTLVLTASVPLRNLLALWDQLQYAGVLLARLQDVQEQRPEQDPAEQRRPVPSVDGHLQLRGLSFHHAHTPDQPILCDISLDVPAGSTVALVGRSGSGKSTLLRCLAGLLVPTDGTIEYDGQNLQHLDLQDLRRHIGFVLQEPFLFDATIAQNIAFGHPAPDVDRVREAAAIANADQLIEALPLAYETRVGDSGLRLSTGQAQRISIARAVYDRPTVLLMDEPTSALDAEAERAVKAGIDSLLRGRTAFIAAHRLSTIRDADLICVLESGRLVEQGTHDDLVRRDGLYAYLYGQQLAAEG